MATSPDHPQLQFVQAKGYTKGRPDGAPLWIVIHDMEASETSTRAESTAQYFANPNDGRNVSSHYCVDNNSIVQCVKLQDSAWTVGNRPGNNRGINWELAGFASQNRDQWLDPYGLDMFEIMVPIIQSDATKCKIPLTRRTVDELKALKPGITSHNDLRLAFGGTTHTDPGSNFPWDYFLKLVNQEDDDMEQTEKLIAATGFADRRIGDHFGDLQNLREYLYAGSGGTTVNPPPAGSRAALLVAAAEKTLAGTAEVDVDALAAAIATKLVADPVFLTALAAVGAEARDAVADLGEGGVAQVRTDED